jgi:hypothetical protein
LLSRSNGILISNWWIGNCQLFSSQDPLAQLLLCPGGNKCASCMSSCPIDYFDAVLTLS